MDMTNREVDFLDI
ncbi:unnamed protein product, partial [Rotaria magnacalcarata]